MDRCAAVRARVRWPAWTGLHPVCDRLRVRNRYNMMVKCSLLMALCIVQPVHGWVGRAGACARVLAQVGAGELSRGARVSRSGVQSDRRP